MGKRIPTFPPCNNQTIWSFKMFNLRIKQERNSVYEQNFTADTLEEIICHVSQIETIAMSEITKDGKLYFVFTHDDKTRLFLSIISSLSVKAHKDNEIVPKTPKKARKTAKKQSNDKIIIA